MPGRRNLAKEMADHGCSAPARFHALHQQLSTQLPSHDRALVGSQAILAHLHQLGIRRPNTGPLTWRMVLGWHRRHAFPLVRGFYACGRYRAPSLTTSHATTAWLLTQFSTGLVFGVSQAQQSGAEEATPQATPTARAA